MSSVIESVDFLAEHQALQLEIPGMDGYRADRLSVTISGGVDLGVTESDDVQFVKGLKLGSEIKLLVTATVTKKGFALTPAKDDVGDDKTTYGVGMKVHSLEVA